MKSDIQNTSSRESLEKTLGINGQEYARNEARWIAEYKKGRIPLHGLLSFYHHAVWNLAAFSQNHKFRISGGSIIEVEKQVRQIQDTVILDAYTLIVLAACDCLNLLKGPAKIWVSASSINMIQQFFLQETTDAVSDAMEFLQKAENIEIVQDGYYVKSAADRIFARDVDICLHIAEEKDILYLSCEAILEEILKDPKSDLPKAKYVNLVAAAEKFFEDDEEQRAIIKWKLLKKCDFVNFGVADILKSIELAGWTANSEIVSPYLNFKSSYDTVSFARVYAGTLVALYKQDKGVQEQFLELMIDNLEKTWNRGQYYRNPTWKRPDNHRNARAIDAYVIQNVGFMLGLNEQGLISLPEEQRARVTVLAEKVARTQNYSPEDLAALQRPIFEKPGVGDDEI